MPFCINTKQLLADSLYQLSHEKNIEDITIAEIVKNCNVSRATFYRHFRDKYDLMTWSYEEFIRNTFTGDNKYLPWMDKQKKIAEFFYKNSQYFISIIRYTGQNNFDSFLYSYTYKYLAALAKEKNVPISKELTFAIKIYCYGNSKIMADWLKNSDELSIDEFCQYRYNSMPDIIKSFLK